MIFKTRACCSARWVRSFSEAMNSANSLSADSTASTSSFSFKVSHLDGSSRQRAGSFSSASASGCDQPGAVPKRRLLLGPDPQQPVIGRHGVDAFPERGPQLLRQRKIREGFAVHAALSFGNLQAQRAEQLARAIIGHLELRDPFPQIFDRETHRFPESRQLADVIQRRPPHLVIRRIHAANVKGPSW